MRFDPNFGRRDQPQLQSLKQAHHLTDSLQASRRLMLRIATGIGFIIGAIGIYFSICVLLELGRVPNLSFLENYQPVGFIQIYDRNDKLICKIEGTEKRKIIPLSQITPHMQRAVLSAEDHHFYEHHGIDLFGITRATIANIIARHTVQGGSTITQQLAKNLFFESSERSLATKIAEAIVASQLENRFSKEKILELYLNEVYFGNGAYGIEQAANLYFDKPAAELDIAQSAYIAGLIRWPARGGQRQFLKENISRRNDVIDKMLEYGYITDFQAEGAKLEPMVFRSRPQPKIATNQIKRFPYYITYVLDLIRQMYTEGEMQRHGLKVYTNMDQAAQIAAERALEAGIRTAPPGCTQGALVSVNVKDGAVLALVGGVGDYMKHQWNCAVNPHTTGSAFKPFVYLAAFNHGVLTPATYIDDSPLVIPRGGHEPDYKPKNYDGKYMGDITVAEALAYSRNTCAVRAAQQVGLDSVIDTANRAGITQKLDPQISLALGCSAVSPLEMAAAYGTLARGGVYMKPSTIRRIDDKNGNALRAFYYYPERVFETEPVAQIVDVLQEVVAQGTGTQAKLADRPVAGKTGTSDQAKDLWFVGFTPDLVTAVWGGNPDNKPIPGSHVTGGTVMARIWRQYNQAYYARHDVPQSWFVACTHLAGGFKFPTRETKEEKEAKKVEEHPKPKVVRYEDIDPTYREPTARVSRVRRTSAARPGSGVTEYRWSR
jgi:penicillin-binding protein 1A